MAKAPVGAQWSYGWSMMRIGALLRRRSMDDVGAWYERAGRALHEEGHKPHEGRGPAPVGRARF